MKKILFAQITKSRTPRIFPIFGVRRRKRPARANWRAAGNVPQKMRAENRRKIPANLAILRRPSLSRLRAAYFRAMPRLRKIFQKKRLTGGAPYKKLETKFQITRNAGVSRRAQT